jgi:hypothetical protein
MLGGKAMRLESIHATEGLHGANPDGGLTTPAVCVSSTPSTRGAAENQR